jgi:pimeloyl-ACP methyl ester carboxylesterase
MTMPMIVLLLAAAAATLLVLLIVVAVAQSLNKTGTPTPAEAAAEAAASVAAAVATYTGKTGAATTPTPAHKHGRTPKPPRAFVSAASASRAAAHRSHTAKGAAKDAAAAAEDKQKQTKNTVAGLAYVGGAIAVIGGVVSFIADFADGGDIAPEIKELTVGALHGTMVNARNSDPIVLIVPGSGPTDRDGNNPMGVNASPYRMLADELIEERIATVRIDKRGMFASKDAGDPNAVSPDIYAADIHAWIDAIKADRGEGSGCVFLMGHSEGALMVSRAAAGRDDVCGLVLVAGMGRPMGQVIREQLIANPANAPIVGEAFTALADLEAGRHVDVTNMTPALVPLFAPPVQDYLISVINLDPVEVLRAADKETLVIQGDRDLQVSVADAHLLDGVRNTELRVIDGMNHVLKAAPEDRAGNLATYADADLPLAKDLVRRIRRFVKDND